MAPASTFPSGPGADATTSTAGPAMNDLVGGHVQMFFDLLPVSIPQINTGKVRALALKHALSAKAKDGGLIVIDNAQVKDAKTKALVGHFSGLGLTNALIIDGAELNTGFATAARNIPNIDVLPIQGINVYDILRRQKLVLTKAAVDALEARFK